MQTTTASITCEEHGERKIRLGKEQKLRCQSCKREGNRLYMSTYSAKQWKVQKRWRARHPEVWNAVRRRWYQKYKVKINRRRRAEYRMNQREWRENKWILGKLGVEESK